MIQWVNQACKDWGRAQWWLMFGKSGYPTSSSIARFTEAITHSNVFTMEYPEVLMGQNLLIANAVKTLPELPRAVVSVHYVLRMPAHRKYKYLEVTRNLYYETLEASQIKIANSIEAQEERISRRSEHKIAGTEKMLWRTIEPTLA